MTSVDVLDFYRTMFAMGVEVWIDGGWGVDALLGEQTRFHKDLDIAIQERHVPLLLEVLLARRYAEVKVGGCAAMEFRIGR